MMVFFQTFSNSCITENLSFNGVFLRSKAAARVILVDRIVLAMSAADNFEENTKSDSFTFRVTVLDVFTKYLENVLTSFVLTLITPSVSSQ